jgi:hypothetical protein
MTDYPHVLGRAAAIMLVVCLAAAPAAWAQHHIGTPGISAPGTTRLNSLDQTSVGQFNAYSYGLGTPSAVYSGTGMGGGMAMPSLRSGLGGAAAPGGYTLPGFGLPGLPGGGATLPGTGSKTLYSALGPQTDMGADTLSKQITAITDPGRMAGAALMNAFVLDKTAVLEDNDKAITTFVPTAVDPANPSRYVDLLIKGEQAMRARRYREAADLFAQVRHVAPQAPESLLSEAHAEFGTANYWVMANDIRLALLGFPELPLAKIQLRAFFANSAEFVDLRDQLRHVAGDEVAPAVATAPATPVAGQAASVDASVLLSLAYVEWFDGHAQAARQHLVAAARVSTDPLLSDAIETFWKGVVQAGGAKGQLVEQAGLVEGSRTARSLEPTTPPPALAPAAPKPS